MMTIMNGIANAYADAYTQTAGWITTHPVITSISVIAGVAVLGILVAMTVSNLINDRA